MRPVNVLNSLNAKICCANQLTGFHIMATWAFNDLTLGKYKVINEF